MTSNFNDCDVTVANSDHKKFSIAFWRALVPPPHFIKSSATHGCTEYKLFALQVGCRRKIHSTL